MLSPYKTENPSRHKGVKMKGVEIGFMVEDVEELYMFLRGSWCVEMV